MAEFEKDFVLRQAKDMSKLLAKFMDKEAVEQVMSIDEEQGQKNEMEKKTTQKSSKK